MTVDQPTIVILGGGFAGIRAALDLRHAAAQGVRTVLIDRNSYHLFTPWLYEHASTADVPKRQLTIPFTTILKHSPVEVLRGEVVAINRSDHVIVLRSGQTIAYTALILACGSTSDTYDIPGVDQHALPLKTVENAVRIRTIIHERYTTFAKRHQPGDVFQVIIGGAGPTGIELTAQLHSYLKELAKRYEHDEGTFLVKLLDSASSLLRGLPPHMSMRAQQRLAGYRRIEILLQHTVASADRSAITLKTGDRLTYDVFVWTGGIKANPLVTLADLQSNTCGQAEVRQTMQSVSDPAVFVVGDAAFCLDPSATQRARAGVENAYQQGRIAARNALRYILGQPMIPVAQHLHGMIIPLKTDWASSSIFGIPLRGRVAYWLMLAVNLRYFLSILPLQEAVRRWYHKS